MIFRVKGWKNVKQAGCEIMFFHENRASMDSVLQLIRLLKQPAIRNKERSSKAVFSSLIYDDTTTRDQKIRSLF